MRNGWVKLPSGHPFPSLSVTPVQPFPPLLTVPSIGKKTRNRKDVQKETVNRPCCA
jgi:hypothetical protein